MDRQEFLRIRTDTLLSLVSNHEVNQDLYLKAFSDYYGDETSIEKQDQAILGMLPMTAPPQYHMENMDSPSPLTTLNLPSGYEDYIAGQRRFVKTYAQDWPMASEKNRFGKRHPLSYDLPTMPLLHGAEWGEPAFVDHLLHLIEEDEEGQSVIKSMKDAERMGVIPKEYAGIVGRPTESLHDLYMTDRKTRFAYADDDEYIDAKKEQWGGRNSRLGLLSYLFGLEWQSSDQREAFMDTLKKLGGTEGPADPNARKIMNDFTATSGISWDRAKRNWFERLIPVARWWERPSDRHGPVSAEDIPSGLNHMKSPWVKNADMVDPNDNMIEPSANHHWWLPFQHWGGVGRDAQSLQTMLRDSYPAAMQGWLGDEMVGFLADRQHPLNDSEDAYHSSGSSFFPKTANHPLMAGHPHRSAVSTGWAAGSDHPYVRAFPRRRALWSSVSNSAHLHPSEIEGSGKRMIIPSYAFATNPNGLGRIIASHTDQGQPRIGPTRERHPGDDEYHSFHNDHYEKSDVHIGQMMQKMALQLMGEHGPALLHGTEPNDITGNTLARGNLQQLAKAANMQLMRGGGMEDMRTIAPTVAGGGLVSKEVPLGPISPESDATIPPVYLTGDKDAWGHKMPATLAFNWDRQNNAVRFDVKDKPFETLQRTVHEGHVGMVHPTHADHALKPKVNSIPALEVTDEMGAPPILNGDIFKADDYEPTGVFEKVIVPAHTVYDFSSIDDLRGFTGDWVVQKKPEGKRIFVQKKGGHIKASNGKGRDVSLPKKVKEGIRKQEGDCTFDGVLKDGKFRAIDLLVHKGDDIHMEKLEDRLTILRTLYETDEGVSFPMPADCKFSDREGLRSNMDALGGELWLRDSTSTFMKGKEAHHKWVHYAPDGDGVKKMYGPFPSVSIRNDRMVLEYPGHPAPLVVKGEWDGEGFDYQGFEKGSRPLLIHAERQVNVWGPVGVHLLKYEISEITPYPPFIKTASSTLFKAALLDTDGKANPVEEILTHARKHLTSGDEALTPAELKANIKGLTDEMLEQFGGEYGLELADNGKWTVNQAIDDDMMGEKAISSPIARISGSVQGGGWAGMMDAYTAPRGPTELLDDEATPFFDPMQPDDTQLEGMPQHIKIHTKDGAGEEIDGELTLEGNTATLRYPQMTEQEAKEEQRIKVPMEDSPEDEMPPPEPPAPPMA